MIKWFIVAALSIEDMLHHKGSMMSSVDLALTGCLNHNLMKMLPKRCRDEALIIWDSSCVLQ